MFHNNHKKVMCTAFDPFQPYKLSFYAIYDIIEKALEEVRYVFMFWLLEMMLETWFAIKHFLEISRERNKQNMCLVLKV